MAAVALRRVPRRTINSATWKRRQARDPFVLEAKRRNLRSRAALKLEHLDHAHRFLPHTGNVVDLGCSPGGWCQVARARVAHGVVVGVDLEPMEAVEGVQFVQADVLKGGVAQSIRPLLTYPSPNASRPAHVVLSDMAPSTTGDPGTDHFRSCDLVLAALELSVALLSPGGAFVAKVFQGQDLRLVQGELSRHFAKVRVAKPRSSRPASREVYLVALGFRVVEEGGPPDAPGVGICTQEDAAVSPSRGRGR